MENKKLCFGFYCFSFKIVAKHYTDYIVLYFHTPHNITISPLCPFHATGGCSGFRSFSQWLNCPPPPPPPWVADFV